MLGFELGYKFVTERYTDRLLPGGAIDCGCFRPITTRNWLVMVDFDCRQPLSAVRGEEKGESGDPVLLFRSRSSPAGFLALCGENLRRSWGEENDDSSPCAGFSPRLRREIFSPRASFSRRRHFFSLRGDKERGDLLDICIVLSSELSRLNQGQILLQYVLRLMDISTSHPSPEQLKKSHLHLHQWIEHINSKSFKLENCPVIENLRGTLGLPKVKSSKGKVLMRALYGVKVLTVFTCGVFSVMLSGRSKALIDLHISSEDFFWFEAFSDLQAVVNEEIRRRFDNGKVVIFKEIAAVEACASGLCNLTIGDSCEKEPMQDGIGINHEEEMIAPRKSTDLERQMSINLVNGAKSLARELDSVSKQVNDFFEIVLMGRDALLCNLRISAVTQE
ncbi:hypothetical protein GW17_00031544 [Ensete ventricosum]|nr:hypothetical protein GW17_00031544 [Ensete ventricosum]